MANCRQACQYNTLYGCKAKEYNAICPLTNMDTPITEYKMTNADRIRSMSDYELAQMLATGKGTFTCLKCLEFRDGECSMKCDERCLEWLKKPSEGE